jgi:hypothetical protein
MVALFFHSDRRIKTVEADEEGNWTLSLLGKRFSPKKYKIYAKAFTRDGRRSSKSQDLVLEIIDASEESAQNSDENEINETFEDFVAQEICSLPAYFTPFDSDSSCKINYDEFLILVQEWYDKWRKKGPCDVDLDQDCDLVDFSIVLYYIDR